MLIFIILGWLKVCSGFSITSYRVFDKGESKYLQFFTGLQRSQVGHRRENLPRVLYIFFREENHVNLKNSFKLEIPQIFLVPCLEAHA